MRHTRSFPFEDLFVGGVALIAAAVCVLALLDVPHATATRGVSYTNFVRAPAEKPAVVPAPIIPDRPRVAESFLEADLLEADVVAVPLTCSPDAQVELQRLLALCKG